MKKILDKSGFTLIELLLTLAIFSIVMAAVLVTYNTQQHTYSVQKSIAEMQQNLRASMFMIARDCRLANAYLGADGLGYWKDDAPSGSEWQYMEGVDSHNNYNNLGSDIIDIAYANFNVNAWLQPQPGGEYMPRASSVSPVDDTDGFFDGDYVVISNGDHSNMQRLTSILEGSSKLQHNPAGSPLNAPANTDFPHDGYGAGTRIFKLRFVSYRIDHTDSDHPKLAACYDALPDEVIPIEDRVYQPLANNIEDLQFEYIFEDGTVADEINNPPTGDPADFENLRAIRIHIVARSDREFPGYIPSRRPLLADHLPGQTDHYLRRVYTMTVQCRNMGLGD